MSNNKVAKSNGGMTMKFALVAMVSTACGNIEMPSTDYGKNNADVRYISYELEDYVNNFAEDAEYYGHKLNMNDIIVRLLEVPIEYQNKKDDGLRTLGVCLKSEIKTPYIYIDPERWQTLSDIKRKMLVYHELGHCKLNRKHTDQQYKSIMGPVMRTNKDLEDNEDYYIEELFTHNPVPKYKNKKLR